jgi:hypothetical protein
LRRDASRSGSDPREEAPRVGGSRHVHVACGDVVTGEPRREAGRKLARVELHVPVDAGGESLVDVTRALVELRVPLNRKRVRAPRVEVGLHAVASEPATELPACPQEPNGNARAVVLELDVR